MCDRPTSCRYAAYRARAPEAGGRARAARAAKRRARGAPRNSTHPGVEQFAAPLGPLLGGDGVADVVFPHAVDLEVAGGDALFADAELRHHAPRRRVARD